MRPYLAVIKDSFREALASRVLWILLVLMTVLLLAIAPLGLQERAGAHLNADDVTDAAALARKLVQESSLSAASPAKHVWALLSDDLKRRLTDKSEAPRPGEWPGQTYFQLREELNGLLPGRKLYDAEAWSKVLLGPEAKTMLAKGIEQVPDDELPRLNRLLLENAFPFSIARSRASDVSLTYLTWTLFESVPGRKRQLVEATLASFTGFFVGTLGVFAAVLVTASIMPQTFEAGAIDLLLSKPISRSLLYFTKYLGGCAFTAINALYMIAGLWLIVGLRFGIWSPRLWLCVPLFLFLFAIYYSISALAGAVWRNAIISVVITILFWGACFSVGTVKGISEVAFLDPQRFIRLTRAGDTLVAANERGEAFRWENASSEWKPILKDAETQRTPPFMPPTPLVGPLYDPEHDRLFAVPTMFSPFGMTQQAGRLRVARRENDWQATNGVAVPSGLVALLVDPQGRLLAVTPQAVFRLDGDPTEEQRDMKLFGFDLPLRSGGSRFVEVSPALRLRLPLSAAMHPRSGALALYDGGRLVLLTLDGAGNYETAKEEKLEGDAAGVLAIAGDALVLGLDDGRIRVYDLGGLSLRDEIRPEGGNAPRFIEASDDGRYFAVAFHHRRLWLYDARERRPADLRVDGQGDISAVAFDGDQLLVADQFTRVSRYGLAGSQLVERYVPQRSALELVYLYGVRPFYMLFPKPGELSNFVRYVLTGEETVQRRNDTRDLQSARVRLDVWGPLWSNLAFTAVLVALGCLYTQRKDF